MSLSIENYDSINTIREMINSLRNIIIILKYRKLRLRHDEVVSLLKIRFAKNILNLNNSAVSMLQYVVVGCFSPSIFLYPAYARWYNTFASLERFFWCSK